MPPYNTNANAGVAVYTGPAPTIERPIAEMLVECRNLADDLANLAAMLEEHLRGPREVKTADQPKPANGLVGHVADLCDRMHVAVASLQNVRVAVFG